MDEDACAINRNTTSDLMMMETRGNSKMKFPKQEEYYYNNNNNNNNNFDACRNKRKFQDEISEELPVAKHTCLCLDISSSSAKDSNSFSDDAPPSTSSSVNWSGTTEEETKTCDDITFYEEEEDNSEFSSSMEDLFCSNAVISNNSVLSSGRWNVNQGQQAGRQGY
ncbi:putative protein FAR-RED ELONGATED HYPOCOTYL 1 [Helianthus annuus]|nr:putative protein FAR-RED ELONGATED HYPOCOTYL 1 [Helianthus annuus]KAJ0650846.1 putative protein FAR-RED ELONGATED HYPOCOTYL 1 [Helianthus annuus]